MNRTVLVVGAGVIGCNLAHELARRGAAVTVIDAAEVAAATSSATFAWVNAYDKAPAEYHRLNALGLRAHERARQALDGGADWFHQIGNLHVAMTNAEMATLQRKAEELRSNGYEAMMLSPQEVQDLEPALKPDGLVGGTFYPKEGWIDTIDMCSGLLHRARDAGAVFFPYATVTSITKTGVTTKRVDGSTQHREADVTILAAGNGNRTILGTAGIEFPTLDPGSHESSTSADRPTGGLISTTAPIDSGIQHVVHAPGRGIALRPARNGGVAFTDSATGGEWARNDPKLWAVPELLLERARTLYPTLGAASTETVTIGTRVLPSDGLTIADWVTNDRTIYAVATHSGVTLAAHLGETVAEEVLTGTRHRSLDPFGLSRFAN